MSSLPIPRNSSGSRLPEIACAPQSQPQDEDIVSVSDACYQHIFTQSLDGILVMQLTQPVTWEPNRPCVHTLETVYRTLRVVEVNDAALKQYGATAEQLIGMTQQDFFAHDPGQGRSLLLQFLNAQKLYKETEERRLDTGEPVFFEESCTGLYTAAGDLMGCFIIQRDITARRQMEHRLRVAEEKYRRIFDQALEGIFQSTPDGRYINVNQAFAAMHGYESPEAMIAAISHIATQIYVNPADRDRFMAQIEAGELVNFETQVYRQDGSIIWVSETAQAIRDAQGRVLYYEGINRNISERKKAELALRASEERYRRLSISLEQQVDQRTRELIEALGFEALLKRITDRVRDSLDEQQILQTVVEELVIRLQLRSCNTGRYDLGQQVSMVVHDCSRDRDHSALGAVWKMDEFPHIYRQLLNHQYFQFCDCHTLLGWVTILVAPIYDDQGPIGDLWLIRDPDLPFTASEIRLVQQITNQCAIAIRQARLYQSAQEQVKELERLNSLKDDFLSTVSHELRTPIASIKMASEMLELSLEPIALGDRANRIRRYLAILQTESDREISLINDLLDLSRLDAESMLVIKTVVHLQHWLPHLIEPLHLQLQRQQIQFSCEVDPGLPSLMTDLASLERIVMELLRNACKYTPPQERICLSAKRQVPGVAIIVSNSGTAIPPQERDRIFDKFYRIPNADPWKHGGTGLGLSLVKRLAEFLGGSIHLECADPWVRFIVTLPLELPER
jgi:PAS domain S-box-containing protein